ncbi:MAG TPA: NFACT family protein [Candidatus Nanoarchaeia archaeon]|nr:NFACT family protein [Candidatus Nanoarchaeia archaeon]
MISLSGLDVKYLVRELKELENTIVEKVYQTGEKEVMLALHSSGAGKKLLKIVAGQAAYLAKEKGETKETPTSFSMALRKYLRQARVVEVVQAELERIIEVKFSNDYRLILELFSKGNVILIDKDGKITVILERQEWKHRTLEKGRVYIYPPPTINPFKLSEEEFRTRYNESDKESAVKVLATDFALGGKYAEEVCALAKIDKRVRRIDTIKVWKSIQSLESKKLRPHMIAKGLKQQEIVPIDMVSEPDIAKQYFNTISEALESYEKNFGEEVVEKQEEKEKLEELAKLQLEQIAQLKKETEDFKKIGDMIYAEYGEIDALIKEVREKKWKVQDKRILEMKKAEGKIIIEL